MIRIGNFFFKYRNQLFPITLVVMVVLFRPRPLMGDPAKDIWLDLAGILVAVLGDAVRCAVIGLEYIKRGGKGKQVYADELVTGGIFAHSRNPLYVGNLMMILGLSLIFHHPVFYAVCFGGGLFVYFCITLAEEQFLHEKFGEKYERYCAEVPRFIPKLSGLGATLRKTQFDWRRVLRKEYGTMFSLFTWIVLLLAVQSIVRQDVSRLLEIQILTPPILACAAAWILGLCAWAVVRVLKKRHVLGAG